VKRRIRSKLTHWHAAIANGSFYGWLSSSAVRRVHVLFPPLPNFLVKLIGTRGPTIPRSLDFPELPDDLKTYPGVLRDRKKEEEAFESEGPLGRWTSVHATAMSVLRRHQWLLEVFTIPRRNRDNVLTASVHAQRPGSRVTTDPVELTRLVKDRAAEIGLAAVGVTHRDPLVTFDVYQDETPVGDTVIVCVSEQAYEPTQTIPSFRAEVAHYDTYMKQFPAQLASYLRSLGYTANVYGEYGMNIAYAVEAGLGQLGLNGQLLTPFAGPRIRLHIVITDAPLAHDRPVDYGVPAICDKCQSCVRNCPTGAIRSAREWHRGVYKAKIKTERCLPVVVQAHGCAVCMKVCPIQRYGLPAVIDEYKRSGQILGTGTDELEGFDWPFDGQHYGPGEKPRDARSPEFLDPPHYYFDVTQTRTPEDSVAEARVEAGGV
jgi:epoxyqueuosine reductase